MYLKIFNNLYFFKYLLIYCLFDNMTTLIIRVDAHVDIGTGHFMRCLALAQYWQKNGGEIHFVMHNSQSFKDRICKEGMNLINLDEIPASHEDALKLIDICDELNGNWIIVDGYHFNADYINFIKQNNIKVLLFDDEGKLDNYSPDIVLNQNVHARAIKYNFLNNSTKLLLGSKYFLLRTEFSNYLNYKKHIKEVATNILVTLGGSDKYNYSLKVLKAINNINDASINVIVLLGLQNSHKQSILDFIRDSKLNITLLQNINDMPSKMEWADLAFSSGGTTVWELAFMGVPVIVGGTSHIEEVMIEDLTNNNLFKSIKRLDEIDESDLTKILCDVIYDEKLRKAMSRDGQKCVDGFGCFRVYKTMIEIK